MLGVPKGNERKENGRLWCSSKDAFPHSLLEALQKQHSITACKHKKKLWWQWPSSPLQFTACKAFPSFATFAWFRGVMDPNSDTKWALSADSDAGLRLLGLHEQQKTANLLLTTSTRIHLRVRMGWVGGVRLNAKNLNWQSRQKWTGVQSPASDAH